MKKENEMREDNVIKQDISNEIFRLYRFSKGGNVTVHNPQTLEDHEDKHIITDREGNVHEIPKPWIHMKYKVWGDEKEKDLLMEDER